MAFKCAWCGSPDTMAGFDQSMCLSCGRFTTTAGDRTVATSEANEGVTVADLPPVPEPDPAPGAPEAEPAPEPVDEPEAPADTPDE